MGALGVTGDLALTETFAPQIQPMPAIPAPTAYRDRDNLTHGTAWPALRRHAGSKNPVRQGPESVVAFIMEPIGGAATAALVAPDSYFARIREICDKYGILLIHDEVMSGAAAPANILAAITELQTGYHHSVEGDWLRLCGARRHGSLGETGETGARHGWLPARLYLCRQSARLVLRVLRFWKRWSGSASKPMRRRWAIS